MARRKTALITQKNEMTEGRCDWSIYMSRAFVRVTDLFETRYNAWRAAHPDVPDIFGWSEYESMMKYDIPRSDMAVVGKDGKTDLPKVEDFKEAFNDLADVGIIIGKVNDTKNWMRLNIISGVKYDKETDSIHVEVGSMMVDYLVELKKKYTGLNPWIAMKFRKSKYTFRFYEFCCQWRKKGEFDLSVDDLKHRFMLDEQHITKKKGELKARPFKYNSIKDLKKYVIDPARDELQELFDAGDCDICFDYDPRLDKSHPGRPTVTGFHFTVKTNAAKPVELPKPKPLEPSLFQDANSRLIQMRQTLMYYWSRSYDKEWPKRAIQELGKKVTADDKLLEKVELFIQDTIHDAQKGKVQNVPGTIHEYFRKQLGIVVDKGAQKS